GAPTGGPEGGLAGPSPPESERAPGSPGARSPAPDVGSGREAELDLDAPVPGPVGRGLLRHDEHLGGAPAVDREPLALDAVGGEGARHGLRAGLRELDVGGPAVEPLLDRLRVGVP